MEEKSQDSHEDGGKLEKEIERKAEKDLLKIAGFAVLLVAVLAAAYFGVNYYIDESNKVKYKGLEFNKEMIGTVLFYHLGYYSVNNEGKTFYNNMYLRIDPRENKVPVEGKISFDRGKNILIGLSNMELEDCEDSLIAVAGLTQFLMGNQYNVRAGILYEEEARESGHEWINCEKFRSNSVIEISKGNETKITSGNGCIKIQINECKILEATEKLQVQALIDSMD
jgi:hypothetical protein